MIELRDYQQRAVCGLQEKVYSILRGDPGVCVFNAPTGSGKTLCVAELIRQLVIDNQMPLAFIWISVHNLHRQSKLKLEKHYSDLEDVICSEFDDLQDGTISSNEILFFNWESINKRDNIYIRDNERNHNLSSVVKNTKKQGSKLVLIIDESHHTAEGKKSVELIEKIAPDITIEVSATPQISGIKQIETVEPKDVIESGMIKKEIPINQSLDRIKIDGKSEDELVVEAALQKREELKAEYERLGRDINPLVLIQLPDRNRGPDRLDEIIRILQNRFNIGVENGRLAIHLSEREHKVNLENIEKNNNEVQVLIFKQALALGWDCPRASVLVLFRVWGSIEFSIQTVGRIMRMPELIHYDSDVLNSAYVYSNISRIEIARDVARDYFTVHESRLNEAIYTGIKLTSTYIKRQHEKTRLNAQISKILQGLPDINDLKAIITTKPTRIENKILVDGKIHDLDRGNIAYSGKNMAKEISEKDLDFRFSQYSRLMVAPFAQSRSSQILRSALYKLFENKLGITDYAEVQRVVLAEENIEKFSAIITKAKDQYRKEVVSKITQSEAIPDDDWGVPKRIMYTTDCSRHDFDKSVLIPTYVKKEYEPEMLFMKYLDRSPKVKWWFKNGERDRKYFAVPYEDGAGNLHAFYVDFVVRFHDNTVGLYDTKEGFTIDKLKAKALAEFIAKNKKMAGGLVTFSDNVWRCSRASESVDVGEWEVLELP